MEPNNIENQIREKLNSREIQPSTQAWDRLDAMLTVAETKKPRRNFYWLAIAASFIVFLTVGTLFFNENAKETRSIKSVVIENKTQKTSSEAAIETIQKDVNATEKVLKKTTKALVQTQNKGNMNDNDNVNSNDNDNIKNQTAKTEEAIAIVIQPNDKIEQIANQGKLNYIDVDDLLASVEKTSKTEKSSVKINSAALLNEIDGELELTFREKTLNTITKKYKEAKVAIANRNNQ